MSIWLSIILPVYNVEKYIVDCLESVVKNINEQDRQVEVIIVDDGATDDSGVIANRYASRYDYIQVIHKENQGVAQARNTGINAARGKWLYFADSDDRIAAKGVYYICKCSKENADADIILFDALKSINNKDEAWEHFSNNMVLHGKEGIRKLQRSVMYYEGTPLAAPWDKVYKKSFLDKNHIRFQSNLKVLDDMVFNVEAFGKADKVVYCKEKIYHYRYVPESITNSYKPDRVEQDLKVWDFLQTYMSKNFYEEEYEAEKNMFQQAYFCRVIKSFSICCRLCFFNRQNEKNLLNKIKYMKEVLALPIYDEAFKKVKLKNAEWKLKIVILMGRAGMGFGIYLLHLANTWQTKHGIQQ